MVYVDFGKEIKKKVMQEPKEVQFNIENTTNQPVTIDLFDASSLTPISLSTKSRANLKLKFQNSFRNYSKSEIKFLLDRLKHIT